MAIFLVVMMLNVGETSCSLDHYSAPFEYGLAVVGPGNPVQVRSLWLNFHLLHSECPVATIGTPYWVVVYGKTSQTDVLIFFV